METGAKSGGPEGISSQQYVFGALFLIANKLQTMLDREFAEYNMTAKQWLLSIVVDNLFDGPPTLKETAAAMGSTHQNVKQVALKMQRNGFMEIRDDEHDGRAVRLLLTDKSRELWLDLQESSVRFMGQIYDGLGENELEALRGALGRVWFNIEQMEKEQEQEGSRK